MSLSVPSLVDYEIDRMIGMLRSGAAIGTIATEFDVDPGEVGDRLRQAGISDTELCRSYTTSPKIERAAEKVAAMHRAGASIKTIMVEIGASVGLVKKCLRRAGIKIETPSGKRYKLTPAVVEKMIEMRRGGATIKAIAVETGASTASVQYYLRRSRASNLLNRQGCPTPADVEKMIEMRRGGAETAAIAAETGASTASVQYYLRRAGLSNPSGRSSRLTSADIEKMTTMYKGGATYAAIAAEIGVSSPTARLHLLQSGVAAKQPWRSSIQHRYTAADIEKITAMRQAGAKNADIAAEIGVSGRAISNILTRFGLANRVRRRT